MFEYLKIIIVIGILALLFSLLTRGFDYLLDLVFDLIERIRKTKIKF